MPLRRKFVGLFRPNSVAEYRVVSIFTQKTEQETVHPNIFLLQSRVKCVRHYWKRVPGGLRNLIACDVRGSPQSRLFVFFSQDAYCRLRNLQRVFLRFGTVFSFRSIKEFISFGKWRIHLSVRCKNWCQEISAYKFVNKLFKVPFPRLIGGSSKYARNNAYTVSSVQA